MSPLPSRAPRNLLWTASSLLVASGLLLPLAAPALADVLAVDTTGTMRNGKTGHFSSLVASADEIAISYYCETDPSGPFATSYAVRFAWKSGDCWQWTNLGEVGAYSSLKRDSTGLYHMMYSGVNGLVWAYGAGRSWTITPERVDTGVAIDQMSMVLDSASHPHVAYFDDAAAGGRALRYTFWNGDQWMRGPSETIANNIWTPTIMPGNSFLAIDSANRPHVAFAQPADEINAFGEVKYASLQNGAWSIESLGQISMNPSLAIGTDDIPRMAFESASGTSATYAYRTNGQWHFETIPTGGLNPNSVSLALGPGNTPTVCFAGGGSEDMYLSTRDAAGAWTTQFIDGDGNGSGDLVLGRLGTGLDVDPAGNAHVSYWAVTIYNTGVGFTNHFSDLRYYTTGSAGTICPEVPGACCDLSTLACEIRTPSTCGGFWDGSAACTPDICDPTGACCDPTASTCTIMLRSECLAGVWNGAPSCQPDPCDPVGACCDPNSNLCSVLPISLCSGAWYDSAACDPDPCDPIGACCSVVTGECVLKTATTCFDIWDGSTSCSPNPCPPPEPTGACCNIGAGTCAVTLMSACADLWNGAPSCVPNPCSGEGACCESTECTIRPVADCDGDATYQGSGTACGPANNPTTCCPANFNRQSGVTVQDIFDFLSAYFNSEPAADFNASASITVQDIFDFLTAYFAGC